jgi:hypothetical protein
LHVSSECVEIGPISAHQPFEAMVVGHEDLEILDSMMISGLPKRAVPACPPLTSEKTGF